MFSKIKIFISSVQPQFAHERAERAEYIYGDSLLGRHFNSFIFEKLAASNTSVEQVFLSQINLSDIYIGILGEKYGPENENGVSPTETEYDVATHPHKTTLIYLKEVDIALIHPKKSKFIHKIQN